MTWAKRYLEWTEGQRAYLSVVFTWDLPKAYQRAVWLREMGYEVHAGGPAVDLMPDVLADVAQVNGCKVDALSRHNPLATFTSRGCVRRRTSARRRGLGRHPNGEDGVCVCVQACARVCVRGGWG